MIRPSYNRRKNYYSHNNYDNYSNPVTYYDYNQENYNQEQFIPAENQIIVPEMYGNSSGSTSYANYENCYYQEKKNVGKEDLSTDKEQNATGGDETVGGAAETSPECLMKHPLENTWTLWYLESDRTKSWEDLQNEITSFDTVEDFWSLYNHIKLASEIKVGSDYSLFKKGIRPMWEDEANKRGGRWVITLTKQQRRTELDSLWLDVLLCLIGEAFEHSDQICGAVVNIRPKADKISIWTADGNNEEAAIEIGQKLKETLRLDPDKVQLVYQLHKDTMVKQGSGVKSTYTL